MNRILKIIAIVQGVIILVLLGIVIYAIVR